jgi:hypothetical protein
LPSDADDFDNNHAGGIPVRYDIGRQFLCVLLARQQQSAEESLQVDAFQWLVERDIPAMLRTIASEAEN